jgi:hypothetical protein
MAACPAIDRSGPPDRAHCDAAAPAPYPAAARAVAPVRPPDGVGAAPLENAYAKLEAGEAKSAERWFERAGRDARKGTAERGWATYGLAHAQRALGEHGAALVSAGEALRDARARKDETLRAAAEPLYLALYASAGDVESAYEGFRPLSGDAEGDERRTLGMLEELVAQAVAAGNYTAAVEAVGELAKHEPERACAHRVHQVELAAHATRGEAAYAVAELIEQVQEGHADDACRRGTARALATLADKWTDEGLAGGPEIDRVALDYAAQLNGALLDLYAQDEVDALGVCVDLVEVAYSRAGLLQTLSDWQACGPAYERAFAADPRGHRGEVAALAAVTCRHRAWLAGTRALERADANQRMLASIGRADDWRSMLRSFHRFLCIAEDLALELEEPYAQVAIDRAEAFAEGGAFWEAAVALRAVAFSDGNSPSTIDAAQRYAQLMEKLATDDACRIDLEGDLERLIARHCNEGEPSAACDDLEGILARVRIR